MILPSFALINGDTYIDQDGKPGRYSYDSASGILSMAGGTHNGSRYVRTSVKSFQRLDEQGHKTSATAVWDIKDPNKRPW